MISDGELMAQVKVGDTEAFANLVERQRLRLILCTTTRPRRPWKA